MKLSAVAASFGLLLTFAAHTNAVMRGTDNPSAIADLREVPVTIDNFVRAATDVEFRKYVALAGGVNRFYHFREPTLVENQPTVRMNRDTLYSAAIVDISEKATLKLPTSGIVTCPQ